ncbi:MAG TPA: long-chain-fatty-acid--CoA ligase [Blastocatellia bacterium]|nr:long-chain-fatty-acid--CoA ligase [Blastocatellia bacterium]
MVSRISTLTTRSGALHEVLQATARALPEQTAVEFLGRSLSFADLDAQSNRLANGLRLLGLAPGDRLGIFMANCPEWEIGFYAASKLGAIACPINSAYREREITYQLNDAGATILLAHATLWPIVQGAREQLNSVREIVLVGSRTVDAAPGIRKYDAIVRGQSADPPATGVDPSQVAVLLYSSGTTGLPKGVMLTHRNLVANHEQHMIATGMGKDDRYIVYTPLPHIFGMALMGMAIRSGARQILLERFDLDTVVRLIQQNGVTWLFAVPPVLLALANAPGLESSQFRTIKFALSGAAPLAPEIARAVEARLGIRVIQGYGSTEAGATHYSPLDPDRIKVESSGVPMAATEHRVLDLETGERPLAAGEVGEIAVRGPQVMKGYWNAPEETSRVLGDGWLRTGDIGWIDDEGYIYISDRKKEMIKYKSFSIAPAELEAVVLEYPDVLDCGVTGVPDPDAGEVPKAFVVPQAGHSIDLDALAVFVAERVAGYKQIRQFEMVDSIPRTASGKILRRLLKR